MTESIHYIIIKRLENVEIRQYPKIITATVYGESDDVAFGHLFNYIAGNNESKKKIPMTAPVITSEEEGEKIPMTAPVLSGTNYFSFVLPPDYSVETVPKPLDDQVKIEEIGQRFVAAVIFKGRAPDREVNKHTDALLGVLKRNGVITRGEPFLMRYNSPFAPGFIRRNEVGIEIEHIG
jgi:hypothetical protein